MVGSYKKWGGAQRNKRSNSLGQPVCFSGVNTTPVKVSSPQLAMEPAWTPAPPSLLPPDPAGELHLPFSCPLSWLHLRLKAVRYMLHPSPLRDVHYPWPQGGGPQFISQLRHRASVHVLIVHEGSKSTLLRTPRDHVLMQSPESTASRSR